MGCIEAWFQLKVHHVAMVPNFQCQHTFRSNIPATNDIAFKRLLLKPVKKKPADCHNNRILNITALFSTSTEA